MPSTVGSTPKSATSATSTTFSHTIASGSNLALAVTLAVDNSGAQAGAATWNGTDVPQIAEHEGNRYSAICRLANPEVGTFNVVASWTNTSSAAVTAWTFDDVHQTTPTGTPSSTGTSGNTTLSVSPASASGDLVIDVISVNGNETTLAADGSQTEQENFNAGGSSGVRTGTSEEAGGAGTTTMSWTWTNSVAASMIAVALKPPAAGAANPKGPLNMPLRGPMQRVVGP